MWQEEVSKNNRLHHSDQVYLTNYGNIFQGHILIKDSIAVQSDLAAIATNWYKKHFTISAYKISERPEEELKKITTYF